MGFKVVSSIIDQAICKSGMGGKKAFGAKWDVGEGQPLRLDQSGLGRIWKSTWLQQQQALSRVGSPRLLRGALARRRLDALSRWNTGQLGAARAVICAL